MGRGNNGTVAQWDGVALGQRPTVTVPTDLLFDPIPKGWLDVPDLRLRRIPIPVPFPPHCAPGLLCPRPIVSPSYWVRVRDRRGGGTMRRERDGTRKQWDSGEMGREKWDSGATEQGAMGQRRTGTAPTDLPFDPFLKGWLSVPDLRLRCQSALSLYSVFSFYQNLQLRVQSKSLSWHGSWHKEA